MTSIDLYFDRFRTSKGICFFSFLFYKRNKKLVPRALLSYISTWEFLKTLEKCEKHPPAARASGTSLVFLKIIRPVFYFFNRPFYSCGLSILAFE